MTITNIILSLIVLLITAFAVYYFIKKKKEEPVEETINVDDKTYTLDAMRDFVKRRLDEKNLLNTNTTKGKIEIYNSLGEDKIIDLSWKLL